MGDARIVSAETETRQAPSTKGKRYGELDAPYLIVVLSRGPCMSGNRALSARALIVSLLLKKSGSIVK